MNLQNHDLLKLMIEGGIPDDYKYSVPFTITKSQNLASGFGSNVRSFSQLKFN